MPNRRQGEFNKVGSDGSRPDPGNGGKSSTHMNESTPSKSASYGNRGSGHGYPPHGRKVKAYPQGNV